FAAAHKSHFLGGGGFDGNILNRNARDTGDGFLHYRYKGFDLWRFEAKGTVDIPDGITLLANQCYRTLEENFAVDILVVRICIRKMNTDVAKRQCAQQGIANGMQ